MPGPRPSQGVGRSAWIWFRRGAGRATRSRSTRCDPTGPARVLSALARQVVDRSGESASCRAATPSDGAPEVVRQRYLIRDRGDMLPAAAALAIDSDDVSAT